jgi:hypothetical protein
MKQKKFKNIIEYLNTIQNEIELLQESILPAVGIFYYIDGIVESQQINLPLGKIKDKDNDEIKSVLTHLGMYVINDDYKTYIGYKALHIDMFKDLIKRLYPQIKDWKQSPRGRIMYNITDGKFECLMDKCLDDINIKKQIKKEFNISKLDFFYNDKNYTCENCK